MRTRTLILVFAASTAFGCSSGSDEDTSGNDAAADSSSESQTSDVAHDGDAGAGDTSHAGDTHAGDSSSSDAKSDSTIVDDSTTTSDSATGTDTTWTPDGDCDLPPAPIVDCSAATGPGTCGGPPPDWDAGTYEVGCTAIVPEASGTSCGPLHCTCTDLGSAGTGWVCS